MAFDLPVITNTVGARAFSGPSEPPTANPFSYNGQNVTPQQGYTWVNTNDPNLPLWEYYNGSWVYRSTIRGEAGIPGTSVSSVSVDGNGRLIVGLSDGAVLDAGSVVGPEGLRGPIGPAGQNGQDGEDGESITGPAGPKGDKGDKGDTGATGPTGPKGDTGATGPAGTPADPAALTALTARVASLEAQKVQIEYRDGVAVPAVVVVLGSASVDVPITWPAPFPDTNYTITPPQVTANQVSLLGRTMATVKPGTKTAAGVTVTVTSTGTIAIGQATLSILAYRRGP